MTKKYDDFMVEFKALLEKHGVSLKQYYDVIILINNDEYYDEQFLSSIKDEASL